MLEFKVYLISAQVFLIQISLVRIFVNSKSSVNNPTKRIFPMFVFQWQQKKSTICLLYDFTSGPHYSKSLLGFELLPMIHTQGLKIASDDFGSLKTFTTFVTTDLHPIDQTSVELLQQKNMPITFYSTKEIYTSWLYTRPQLVGDLMRLKVIRSSNNKDRKKIC